MAVFCARPALLRPLCGAARGRVVLRYWGIETRTVTVRAAQHKLQDFTYEGPNSVLAADTQEKRADKLLTSAASWRSPPGRGSEQHDALVRATKEMHQLVKERKYQEALQAFRAVSDPDLPLYAVALNACAKALLWDEAGDIWERIRAEDRTVVTYTTMIDLCRRLKKERKAEEFFEQMVASGVQPTAITYNTMVSVYSMTGSVEKARATFERGRQTVLATASVTTKQIAYLAVMSAMSRAGDYAGTRSFFVTMTEEGIPPNNMHFNALMTSCSMAADAATAQAVFALMPAWSITPRVEDFAILMSCCRQDLPQCLKILSDLEEAGLKPNGRIYQQLLQTHVLAGDGAGAQAVLARAVGLDWHSSKVLDLQAQAQALSARGV